MAMTSRMQRLPVGQTKANGWGLHGMLENADEWVQDWYADYDEGE